MHHEKVLASVRANNGIVTTDSRGKLILGKKLKLKKPPVTLEDTSTWYELKKEFERGNNIFEGVLEQIQTNIKQKKKDEKKEKEIDEEELEKEFIQKKKRLNPVLHKFQMWFERRGFVGETTMTRMTPRDLSLQDLKQSQSNNDLSVPNAYRDHSASNSRFLNISRREYHRL